MAFRFVALFALISLSSAQLYQAPSPLAKARPHQLAKSDEPYDANPQYNFSYDVHDSVSGDTKSQFETRDGDLVRGQYSLIDADGYRRTVEYTADPIHGFVAVVNRVPLDGAPTAAKAAPAQQPSLPKPAQFAYTAPQAYVKAAPFAHLVAPAAAYLHAAPYAHLAYHH